MEHERIVFRRRLLLMAQPPLHVPEDGKLARLLVLRLPPGEPDHSRFEVDLVPDQPPQLVLARAGVIGAHEPGPSAAWAVLREAARILRVRETPSVRCP